MADFMTLSPEIIQRIASYGTLESLISLSYVNVKCREACSDWTVVRDIIRINYNEVFQYAVHSYVSNTSIWRRIAYAICKAGETDSWEAGSVMWAPQMIALHQPYCMKADLSSLFAATEEEDRLLSDRHAAAFCFAARALNFSVSEDSTLADFYARLDTPHARSGDSSSTISSASPAEHHLCYVDPLWTEAEHAYPPTWPDKMLEPLEVQRLALKALGILCVELKASIQNDTVGLPSFVQLDQLAVPSSALDIPFATFMNLPEPFKHQSDSKLAHCHLSNMATAGFMEKSRWSGVHCLIQKTQAERVCKELDTWSPFALSVVADDESSDILELRSTTTHSGVGHGVFQIFIQKSSGVTLISLIPISGVGLPWSWQGILTPFGFFGTCASSPGQLFWLWRRTW